MTRRRFRLLAAGLAAVVAAVQAPTGALAASGEHPLAEPVVTAAAGGQRATASASRGNGTGSFVVWEDERAEDGPTDVYGARISAGGELLDPTGIPIAVGANSQSAPAVAWDGTNYVVVWEDDREQQYETDVYAARVTPGGRVLDRDPVRIADSPVGFESSPAVASSAAGTLIVWHGQWPGDPDDGVQAATLTTDGTVGEAFTIVGRTASQSAPAVAASQSAFLVTWVDDLVEDGVQSDVYAARVSAAGQVLDSGGIAVGDSEGHDEAVTVASDGTDFLMAWTAHHPETFAADVTVAKVAADGAVTQPSQPVVAGGATDETGASLSWNGEHYLAGWMRLATDTAHAGGRVRRLAPDGSAVDLQPRTVSGTAPGDLSTTSTWDGEHWLVGLSVRNDVRVDLVGADGVLTDAAPLVISRAADAQLVPAVAGGPDGGLAVWQSWNGRNYDIRATRLTPDGTAIDTAGGGIVVAQAPRDQSEPDVAWNGSAYLVVWTDSRAGAGRHDIYGSRVTPAGTVRPATRLSPLAGLQYRPSVASGEASFLVAWEEVKRAPADVGGALVRGGIAVERMMISTARLDQGAPDVASDGVGFLVAFEDGRTEDFEITAARVDARGTVLDPRGFAVTSVPRLQVLPSVAWNGRDYVVAWSDNRPADFSYDVYAARVTPAADVRDAKGIAVARGPDSLQNPVVVRRGDGAFLAWQQVAATSDLAGRRLTRTGDVGPRRSLSRFPAAESAPSLASAGDRTILVYQRFVAHPLVRSIRAFARTF